MQPNRTPSDWQQPSEQPAPAPHVVTNDQQSPVNETASPSAPISSPPVEEASAPEPDETTLLDEASVAAPQAATTVSEEPVHWQATEYIHHEKNALWFTIFGLVVVALIALAIFALQSVTFAILIPVMAVALIVYSHRPPRLLDYTLSRQGLHVNDRLYSLNEFKGFGVVHDGSEYSVMLIPLKRFKPGVSVYFPEEAGEAIVDMLGARLPMQELHVDLVDRIIQKLRI
jgi:hypothetical protein